MRVALRERRERDRAARRACASTWSAPRDDRALLRLLGREERARASPGSGTPRPRRRPSRAAPRPPRPARSSRALDWTSEHATTGARRRSPTPPAMTTCFRARDPARRLRRGLLELVRLLHVLAGDDASVFVDMAPRRGAARENPQENPRQSRRPAGAVKGKPAGRARRRLVRASLDRASLGGGRLRRFRSRKTSRIGTSSPNASRNRFSTKRR